MYSLFQKKYEHGAHNTPDGYIKMHKHVLSHQEPTDVAGCWENGAATVPGHHYSALLDSGFHVRARKGFSMVDQFPPEIPKTWKFSLERKRDTRYQKIGAQR